MLILRIYSGDKLLIQFFLCLSGSSVRKKPASSLVVFGSKVAILSSFLDRLLVKLGLLSSI